MIITIIGKPIPKGSTRAFAHKHTGRIVTMQQNAPTLYEYQDRIAHEARKDGAELSQQAISVKASFCFKRPKSHYRANRQLKPSAAIHHTQKPDADKLLRAVLDGLTGVCFADDSQVINATAEKRWGDIDLTQIFVLEVPK